MRVLAPKCTSTVVCSYSQQFSKDMSASFLSDTARIPNGIVLKDCGYPFIESNKGGKCCINKCWTYERV